MTQENVPLDAILKQTVISEADMVNTEDQPAPAFDPAAPLGGGVVAPLVMTPPTQPEAPPVASEQPMMFGDNSFASAFTAPPPAAPVQGNPFAAPIVGQNPLMSPQVDPNAQPLANPFAFAGGVGAPAAEAAPTYKSLEAMPGIKTISLGDRVSRNPIERIKFAVGVNTLISILEPLEIFQIKNHYEQDGMGKILCFEGQCCQDIPKVGSYVVTPVIMYSTNQQGTPISADMELYTWGMAPEVYNSLCLMGQSLAAMGQTVTQIDIMVQCSDFNFQKCTIQQFGLSRWKQHPALQASMQEMQERWQALKVHAAAPYGRAMSPQQYAAQRRQLQAAQTMATPGNVTFNPAMLKTL